MLADFGAPQHLVRSRFEPACHDDLLAGILDVIPAAALIVDNDLQIVHANAEARAMLRLGTPIFSYRQQLRSTSKTVVDKIRRAAQRRSDLSLALPACDGVLAVAHVKPLVSLTHPTRCAGYTAVLISHADGQRAAPVDALAELFGLTPCETRVLAHVVAGSKRRHTATALGLSDATVATHLRNIFVKTGAPDRFAVSRMASVLAWPTMRSGSPQ